MPLWTPQKGIVREESTYATIGGARSGSGVAVTTDSGSASTKGAVAQLIASTSFDAYMMAIEVWGYSLAVTQSEACLDILIGASTAEDPIIENLLAGQATSSGVTSGKYWLFPVYIPAGSRLSARAAGDRLNTAMRVNVMLWGGDGSPPFRVGSKVTTYGIGTVPNGTAITPGTSGAEGGWTEIVASTSMDHFALVPSFQSRADTTMGNLTYTVEMGRGASTAEDPVGADYVFRTTNGEEMMGAYNPFPTFVDIPSGSRLVMRVSNSGANDAGYDGAIHAIS